MRIAITGATGHLGTVLVHDLLKQGHELKALVHTNTKSIEGLPIGTVKGSLDDEDAINELIYKVDAVIHCAALISIVGGQNEIIRRTNVEGVRRMLESVIKQGVKKFVHTSSIHAFNQIPSEEPLNETREYVGNNAAAYDQSKRDGQLLVLDYAKNGLDATIINPTSIVGPPDYRPSLMGQVIIDLCNGKIPALIPGGFDFVDVRDVSRGIIAALHKGRKGEAYLLAGKYHSISEIAKLLSEVSEKKISPPKIPEWMARAGVPVIRGWAAITGQKPLYTQESIDALKYGNRKIDASKAKVELGFAARSFRETLNDSYAWFRDHGFIKK